MSISMQYRIPAILLLTCVLGLCGFRASPLSRGKGIDTGQELVKRSNFVRLTPGLTREEVATRLDAGGYHQFTVAVNSDEYVLLRYKIESAGGQYFLYKNNRLDKIPVWIPPETEEYQYGHSRATRGKSWPVTDESRIFKFIEGKVLSRSELESKLERSANYQKTRPKSYNVLPALLLTLTHEYLDKVERGYERNRALMAQLDGKKLSLGMTEDRVEAILGEHTKESVIDEQRVLRIYGEDLPLRVAPHQNLWVHGRAN